MGTYDGGEYPVYPELSLAEEHVVEPPDRVQPVGGSRFSQHRVKIQLRGKKRTKINTALRMREGTTNKLQRLYYRTNCGLLMRHETV